MNPATEKDLNGASIVYGFLQESTQVFYAF